jgi:hypothetical protein
LTVLGADFIFLTMKQILLTILLSHVLPLSGQDKHDFIWLLGANPNKPEENFGGTKIDFNKNPTEISYFDIPIDFFSIAMISDTKGVLQFYTNSCEIVNREHIIMSNGDSINPGVYHDAFCGDNANIGYPLAQGVLALPIPNSNERYILFHYRREDTGEQKNLLYSLVNMNTPDSLGEVESKNQMLLTDFLADMLTAVRHGNGRDWWILAPKTESQEGYLFLLTPTGIEGPFTKNMGQFWDYRGYNGHSVFSPNGLKYVRANPWNGVRVADFDRCTGVFSNEKVLPLDNDVEICGVAISPNSQYLYVSTGFKLFQYNLNAGNINASKKLVGEYDGFMSPLKTTFFQPMLAPDNKIYMTTTNDNNVLHVIHNPNENGLSCNFEQHGIILPTMHFNLAPNFPHFRLYDLPGSPCDTLGINGPVAVQEPGIGQVLSMSLTPNPASESLTIGLPAAETGRVSIADMTGKIWLSVTKAGGRPVFEVNIGHLPVGVYTVSFQSEAGYFVTKKLVVQR